METVWFCLIAIMLVVYVVLDGFDFGAGIVHLLIARNKQERAQVVRSIGPFWDGNEVWLIAAGGTLYFAFPVLYASSFSGFYLALMMVLWLLILRGIALEVRNHIESDLWRPFWDVVFGGSSALLALLFGVAIGNVVRGVPLDGEGYFFLPLWTNFRPGSEAGIIDWFTLLTGVASFSALALHGGLWVALKTGGELQERSRTFSRKVWWAVAAMTTVITWLSFRVQANLVTRFQTQPWGFAFPLLALAGLAGVVLFSGVRRDGAAFISSCLYLAGMLMSAAFGVYPFVLPSNGNPDHSLTVYNAAAAMYGLRVGLWWWIPGMALATGYSIFVYRHFAGKVEQ